MTKREEAKSLRDAGKTGDEIAAAMLVSRSRVYQLLNTPEPSGKRGRPLRIGPPKPAKASAMRAEQFCRLCKLTLPAASFYQTTSRHGGLTDLCKKCNTLHANRRNWAAKQRKGELQKLIEATESRLTEMKLVMARMLAGQDWWAD